MGRNLLSPVAASTGLLPEPGLSRRRFTDEKGRAGGISSGSIGYLQNGYCRKIIRFHP